MSDKAIKLNSWKEVGITIPIGIDGDFYTTCPNCSADRKPKHQKLKCLGITLNKFDNEIGHCSHCGIKYYVERNQQKTTSPKEKEFSIPQAVNTTDLDQKLVDWFANRKISQQTLKDLKISQGLEFMPQLGRKIMTMQYNYFINDKLINVKYRTLDKNFKMYSGAKLIFYNVNSLKDSKECIISEGEAETLTWHEIGKKAAVSVPSGAQISKTEKEEYERTGQFNDNNTMNLEYLDNSWEYLKHIETFYIATDNDPPGLKLQRELIRRLGPDKCKIIDFGDFKDANEVLCSKNGRLELEECYDKAKSPPIYDVYTIEDDREQLEYELDNGIEKGLSLDIPDLDKHYTLRLGEFDLFNGIPGHGKSYFMTFISLIAALKYGWKFGVYMPEHLRKVFWRRIIEMYIGKPMDNKAEGHMNKEEFNYGMEMLNKFYYFVDPTELVSIDYILDKMKELVLTKGINGCIIGPWNSMYHKKEHGENGEEYLQRRLSQIRVFIRNHRVKVMLEAHPIVMRDTEKITIPDDIITSKKNVERIKVPTAYHLSGGAMWYNRADNIITVYKNTKYPGPWVSEIHIQKIKEQQIVGIETAKDKPINLAFNIKNGRYHNIDNLLTQLDKQTVQSLECVLPIINKGGNNDVPF